MTEKRPDKKDEKPPIPDAWQGEPRLAVFFIPSPVSIPLPHDSTFNFQRDEKVDWLKGVELRPKKGLTPVPKEMWDADNFVSFRVWRLREDLQVSIEPFQRAMAIAAAVVPGVAAPAEDRAPTVALEEESYSTVFEAVTPLIPSVQDGQISLERTVDDAFDRCMENLAELFRAYIAVSADLRVAPITRNSLFILLPWTTRNPDDSEWGGLAVYKPNVGAHVIPRATGELGEDDMNRLMTVISRAKRLDPVAPFVQHARASRRAFWMQADYGATVIEAHISSEVFLDSVLLLMAWEEGTAPEEASEWFDEWLSKRIRTRYGPRLGGNWNTHDSKSLVGQWAERVQGLRNRVAHRGYWPSEQEAYECLQARDQLEDFIKERLAARRTKYQRTTLLVLGMPGLKRLGVYSGRIKKFVETEAGAEPDWLADYRNWANEFDTYRAQS
jgi:hypothetical protein